ncbi:DDE-type integrase/transposase/recombinase [Undibacterium sp. TS12]|uniref:DDE-type integrase/transposase/recombinase n=1 Tax=Undibacterium sp. TS12 TaxID=2908202 RepID=UPI001F4CD20A|nr:DDE-type integrase/transposase/recombinase [Undibacterium sp. TS12]MCH8623111.1 DDE-type integrase/transposase/recombinase [Undibacterium sp. TS12]
MMNELLKLIFCWVLDILLSLMWRFLKHVQYCFGSLNWRLQKPASALFPPVKQFYPRAPKRRAGQAKPRWVLHFALYRHAQGAHSYRQIRDEFNRLYAHAGMTISLGTVYGWVQKYRSEMEGIRKEMRNRFPDFSPANVRWCLDGTGKVDADGVQHFILGMIDHGTRMNVCLQRLELATSAVILEHIKQAINLFGKPQIIRTDNASVFRSKKFRQALKELGIRHEFTEPGKPWQSGRIERFFLSLKQKLNLTTPANGLMLDAMPGDFRTWYNLIRPHQHLRGYTPAEVWTGVDPYSSPPKSVHPFEAWDGLLQGYYLRR